MPVKSLMPPVLGLLMGMNNMNDMKKMMDYETALERRLEKACERNGWIASAHVAFGGDYVNCQLEKFGREEVRDEQATRKALEEFVTHEFGFSLVDNPAALRRDYETIPNTIAPYHLTLNIKVPVDAPNIT